MEGGEGVGDARGVAGGCGCLMERVKVVLVRIGCICV